MRDGSSCCIERTVNKDGRVLPVGIERHGRIVFEVRDAADR